MADRADLPRDGCGEAQIAGRSVRSAAEMLATFGLHNGGKEYRRPVAAFERIFGATFFFGTDRLNGKARVIQRSRFNFFREAQLWYQRSGDTLPLSREFENTIVLSDEFYEEVTAHSIPPIWKR